MGREPEEPKHGAAWFTGVNIYSADFARMDPFGGREKTEERMVNQ